MDRKKVHFLCNIKCFSQDYIDLCSICLFVYESRGQLCDVLVTNQRYNLISSSKLGTTRRGGLEMYFFVPDADHKYF